MRTVGFMCIKNEAHRYLASSIGEFMRCVDSLFVWDDQSDDDSVEIALSLGAEVHRRKNDIPSFLEAEGAFRQAGWETMAERFRVKENDYVIVLDADEFFAEPTSVVIRCFLASQYQMKSIQCNIVEIFDTAPLRYRTDGYWGSITGVRIAAYRDGSQNYTTMGMGCGVFPYYAYKGKPYHDRLLPILHFGYAHEDDRMTKYNRYSSIQDNGHSNKHIESILGRWSLKEWIGTEPAWKRGR